jgi:ribulose-bisphosphate carboxylase large chain
VETTSSSSCEMPSAPATTDAARVTEAGSRVHRFSAGAHAWSGVAVQQYKPAADHHCGVSRAVLAGEGGDRTSFQVRYFEIAPGGHSTLERHGHEHVVVVLRGRGQVRLGGTWHDLGGHDAVYVAPDEVHQLRNVGDGPFGFLCVVDARRDRPVEVRDE